MVAFAASIDGSGNRTEVTLAQSGTIPSDAMSLQFVADYAPRVYLDNQQLTSVILGSGPIGSTLFGVDVSAFSGQYVEVRFQPGLGIDYLDAISFSGNAIPEPSTLSLLCLGLIGLGWQSRRTRR